MYTGLTGSLKIGDVAIAYISNWSIEESTEFFERAKLGDSYKDAIPGIQSWSASAGGAVVFERSDGNEILFNCKHSGEKITLKLFLDDKGTNNGTYFSGEGYIESLSVDLSAEDKGNISISVNGTGKLKLFIGGTELIAD